MREITVRWGHNGMNEYMYLVVKLLKRFIEDVFAHKL